MNIQLIGRIALKIGGLILSVSPLILSTIIDNKLRNKPVTYDDVIESIMHSSMLGSDKSEMISVIHRDGDSELYKAIIHVVNSSVLGSEKIEIVKQLCNKQESGL
jgi:hypothetical protein